MKKVVITGTTGFLGRALQENLLQQGVNVIALVRKPEKIKNKQVQVYQINLENLDELESIVIQNELIDHETTIIHCAAILGAAQASKKKYQRVNTDATIKLYQLASKFQAEKFIFISSMGASGPIGTSSKPTTEDMSGKPRAYYSRSKFEAEKGLFSISSETTPVVCIRPPVIYGPGMNPKSGAALLFRGCKRRVFGIIGRGKNKIQLVYIDNLVNGILTCASAVKKGNEIFFIADDQPYVIMDILNTIKEQLNSNTIIIKFPFYLLLPLAWLVEKFGKLIRRDIGFNTELVRGMATHAYLFSIEKARNYGYSPQISLTEGVKKTLDYLEDDPS